MKENFLHSARGQKLERQFQSLKDKFADLGWLTQGSVVPNHPGHWRWTRKVKAKTVSVSLSPEQADLFKEAVSNHRKLESIISKMRLISQEILLNSAPEIRKKTPKQNHPKPALT